MKKSLTLAALLAVSFALAIALATGCSTYEKGSTGPFQAHNPEHDAEFGFNPFNGNIFVKYYSNDGHKVKVKKISYSRDSEGLKSVEVEDLETFERTVENRVVDVTRIQETYKGVTLWSDSFWAGLDKTLTNAISAAMPGITAWIDANPKADKTTIDTMVMKLFQDALANQLIGAGGN